MHQYILKRLLLTIPTLLGAALLVFILLRLVPGDVCVLRMSGGAGYVSPKAIELCRTELGLDRPYVVQFLDFIWGFVWRRSPRS
jgi:peptide/nickel transport system permease protein